MLARSLSVGLIAISAGLTTVVRAADAQLPDTAAMGRIVDSVRTAMNLPGASVAVIAGDGRVWTGTSGIANGSNAPVTRAHLFELGSITKTYVAALMLDLAAQGKVSLDDSVSKWFPAFPNASGVTVKQLLQHTSGLHNYSENPAYIPALRADFTRKWTPQDNYKYMKEPYFAPGGGWHYSSANYLLLGEIAERVSEMSVAQALRARVLTPRNLERTYFAPDEEPEGQRAHAFLDINGDGKPEDFTSMVPNTSFITAAGAAGALVATAEDVARFGHGLLGALASHDRWHVPMTQWVDRGDGMQHGLGVIRYVVDGQELLGHKGNTVGYSAALWHSTARRLTVAVLTNANAVDVTPLARALLR